MQALSVKNLSFRQKSLFASVYFVSYTAVTLAFPEMLPERIPVPESSACARAALPYICLLYTSGGIGFPLLFDLAVFCTVGINDVVGSTPYFIGCHDCFPFPIQVR